MIRQILHKTVVAVFLLTAVACQDDMSVDSGREVPDGYMRLDFKVDVPDMKQVNTRSVDYDGGGIQDLRLFCFGENGAFISTSKAELKPLGDQSGLNILEGTFSATISEYTRIIHFVANQNMTNFDESAMGGLDEKALMDQLVASSGKMIYWQRVEGNSRENLIANVKNEGGSPEGVQLIRNQARFEIVNPNNNYTAINAFSVYNTSAFGTVAPYNPDTKNFNWTKDEHGYISLPKGDGYTGRMTSRTDQTATADGRYEYVFETENTRQNPVSVILKSTDNLYYRVLIMDENSEFLPIRRNTSYQINITGSLTNGVSSYEAALTAAPTNNVWISIPDDINEISDGSHQLKVDETFVVYQTETYTQNRELQYTYYAKGSEGKYDQPVTESPEITWLTDGNAAIIAGNSYTAGTGTIHLNIPVLNENETVRESVLSVKAGHLERTVKIFLVRQFEFTPAWVSTSIYGETEGQPVTLMFTIPEDLPEELFPLDVKIGADWLNVRQSTGMQLPTITPIENPDKFGSKEDGWKFKFVYTAEKPGVQRLYFNTVLKPEEDNGNYKEGKVTIEADYFAKLSKIFPFSEDNYYITLPDLISMDGSNLGDEMPDGEQVYYCLVPQKKDAPVNFKIALKGENNSDVEATTEDQFLLYAQHIDHYTDEEWEHIHGNTELLECNFQPVDEDVWSTGGRVFLFEPRDNKHSQNTYNIYLRTNCPASAEVVRISSNQSGGTDGYRGRTYRSITFELANYNPFEFSTKVKSSDNSTQQWTYELGQRIDVEFDVTSFRGTDDRSADPFGSDFKVYIDAPMLEIDEDRRGNYGTDIFYEDPSKEGRFIYQVKANRDDNRNGTDNVIIQDDTDGVSQKGEHKVLPFKTRSIVSEGEISISAEEDIVIFNKETFVITNQTIDGEIKYGETGSDWNTLSPVPANAFVTFEIANDGTRIGSMSITPDGHYSLTLRKEYRYSWDATPIELHYSVGGATYHGNVESLKTLFNSKNRNISLYKEE